MAESIFEQKERNFPIPVPRSGNLVHSRANTFNALNLSGANFQQPPHRQYPAPPIPSPRTRAASTSSTPESPITWEQRANNSGYVNLPLTFKASQCQSSAPKPLPRTRSRSSSNSDTGVGVSASNDAVVHSPSQMNVEEIKLPSETTLSTSDPHGITPAHKPALHQLDEACDSMEAVEVVDNTKPKSNGGDITQKGLSSSTLTNGVREKTKFFEQRLNGDLNVRSAPPLKASTIERTNPSQQQSLADRRTPPTIPQRSSSLPRTCRPTGLDTKLNGNTTPGASRDTEPAASDKDDIHVGPYDARQSISNHEERPSQGLPPAQEEQVEVIKRVRFTAASSDANELAVNGKQQELGNEGDEKRGEVVASIETRGPSVSDRAKQLEQQLHRRLQSETVEAAAIKQEATKDGDLHLVVDKLIHEKEQLTEKLEEVEKEIRHKGTAYLEAIHEKTEENQVLMSKIRQLQREIDTASLPFGQGLEDPMNQPFRQRASTVGAFANQSEEDLPQVKTGLAEVKALYTHQLVSLADQLKVKDEKLKDAQRDVEEKNKVITQLQQVVEEKDKKIEEIKAVYTHQLDALAKQLQATHGDLKDRAMNVPRQLDLSLRAFHRLKIQKEPLQYGDDALDQHIVKPKRALKFTKKIGEGSYGSVYAVDVNGAPCIAKRLLDILMGRGQEERVTAETKRRYHQEFFRECVLLSRINHPNIVKFVGIRKGHDHYDLTLILERLANDLEKFLQSSSQIPFSDKVSILCDISRGLVCLHEQSIVHRDLTAANILLTADKQAKIADLGVSKVVNIEIAKLTKAPGALAYMSPEALKDKPYDESLDIFSFGVITLYTALQEFPKFSWENVPDPIVAKGEGEIFKRHSWIEKMEMKQPEQFLCPLVLWCLSDDPVNRPSTVCLNILLEEMRKDYPLK